MERFERGHVAAVDAGWRIVQNSVFVGIYLLRLGCVQE